MGKEHWGKKDKNRRSRRKRRMGSGDRNAHGVGRNIPKDVKREVRKRSGYACVVCRQLPCDYDHFAPPFADLRGRHRAEGIALLCPTCHREKESGAISADQISKSCEHGQLHGWDVALAPWKVDPFRSPKVIAGNRESDKEWHLIYEEKSLVWMRFDPDKGWRFDGELYDARGQRICEIRNNVFRTGPTDVFDFIRTSNRLEWHTQNGIALGVKFDGDRNALLITDLNMKYRTLHVHITGEGEYRSFDGGENLCSVRVSSSPGFGLSVGVTSSGKSKASGGRVRDTFSGTVRAIERQNWPD